VKTLIGNWKSIRGRNLAIWVSSYSSYRYKMQFSALSV